MKTIFSLFFLAAFCTAAYSQSLCYTYDAAGNRRVKAAGPCNAPSGLVAPPAQSSNALSILDAASKPHIESKELMQSSLNRGIIVPNPVSSTFELRLEGEPTSDAVFELYDGLGRKIETKPATGVATNFDLTQEGAGIFYLLLKSNIGMAGQWKVIKQ
jgi:hypothetical protein